MAVWQVVHEHELAAQQGGEEEGGEGGGGEGAGVGKGVVEIEQ